MITATNPHGPPAVSAAGLLRGSAICTGGAVAAFLLFAALLMGSHPSEQARSLSKLLPFAISVATSSAGTALALSLSGPHRRGLFLTSAGWSAVCWSVALAIKEPLGWEVAKFACANAIAGLAPAVFLAARCRLTHVIWAYGLACGVALLALPSRSLPLWTPLSSLLVLPFGQIWIRDVFFLFALALLRAHFLKPTTT